MYTIVVALFQPLPLPELKQGLAQQLNYNSRVSTMAARFEVAKLKRDGQIRLIGSRATTIVLLPTLTHVNTLLAWFHSANSSSQHLTTSNNQYYVAAD